MSLVIEEKYRIPFYLDTNILVDYLDGTYPCLNQSLEFLSKCPFTDLKSSHYVEYELVEVRKVILFFRKATEQDIMPTKKCSERFAWLKRIGHSCTSVKPVYGYSPNPTEKAVIKKCWKFNGHDYFEFKDDIETQVTNELKLLENELAVNFDDHVLHDDLLSPTYQLVLKSKLSREDSLVLTSCMLPRLGDEIDFCTILTRDAQFYKAYSRLDSDAKDVLSSVCHAIPSMKNISSISTPEHSNVNLCDSTCKDISEIWPPIILDLIKSKNSDAYAGETYKFGKKGDSAKCVFFKTQREDNTLQKSAGLCFITPDLSKTVIKSVDEKDFFMNNGVKIPSLPHVLQHGNKVSFMPKDGEGDDIEPIREKGCLVFFHNE